MSGAPVDLACELLKESLAAWRVAGSVERTRDGGIVIGGDNKISIEPAPQNSMFRWMVTIEGRKRPALSLLAVLSQVREALDPGYAAQQGPGRYGAAGAAMTGADVIPVSVLTGFLGSGKTTMLGHLLRQPEFSRTAVIINEFGEIGLDHELIETSEDSIVALTTGCLCCKVAHRSVANAARPAAPA